MIKIPIICETNQSIGLKPGEDKFLIGENLKILSHMDAFGFEPDLLEYISKVEGETKEKIFNSGARDMKRYVSDDVKAIKHKNIYSINKLKSVHQGIKNAFQKAPSNSIKRVLGSSDVSIEIADGYIDKAFKGSEV